MRAALNVALYIGRGLLILAGGLVAFAAMLAFWVWVAQH